jgi:hypothetical protein
MKQAKLRHLFSRKKWRIKIKEIIRIHVGLIRKASASKGVSNKIHLLYLNPGFNK